MEQLLFYACLAIIAVIAIGNIWVNFMEESQRKKRFKQMEKNTLDAMRPKDKKL